MEYENKFLIGDFVQGQRTYSGEIIKGEFNGFHLVNKLDPTSVIGVICVENDRCYDVVVGSIELLESEDEKIKRCISDAVRKYGVEFATGTITEEKMLAWLEKQGKQSEQKEINLAEILKHYPRETELYSPLYGKLWLAEVDEKNEIITCYKHCLDEGCTRAILEQEDTVSFYSNGTTGLPDFNVSEDCMLFLYDIEKQDGQKPVDKVEPKFRVGDWIIKNDDSSINVDYSCCEITKVENGNYTIESTYGYKGYNTFETFEKDYHLWTIQDAKEGDVLVCENGWTCIFKALNSDISFSSYCFMDSTEWFCETGSESHTIEKAFIKAYNGNIYPATKEQRDLLFQKMHEAGYEWDAEKKELKKFEKKPAWSEEDEVGLGDAMWAIEQARGIAKDENDMGNLWYAERWLKSLKQKIRWKPSEEHMKALHDLNLTGDISYAGQGQVLIELYNDLKKLK